MPEPHAFRVAAGDDGARLDQCALRELHGRYSRTQVQRWVHDGFVRLNGRSAPAHRRVKAGDTVTVDVTAATAGAPLRTLAPEAIPLAVVYEDAELLVVDKPAGLVTHPAPGHWSGTLVNAVLGHLERTGQSAPPMPPGAEWRPGIVHRLDKDTSGLLVVAKTDRAHHALAAQLKQRTLRRTYIACVEGLISWDEGTADAPLGRHLTDRKRMTIRPLGGKPAVTHYRVLRRVPQASVGPYTVVECRLETGRTHQVRVHMAHLGHPVLGDATYGGTTRGQLTRHCLHAFKLALTHPVTGARLELEAPVPPDMVALVHPA